MQTTKRRSAQAWREVVARFARSGLTEEDFCEREGIGQKLFHRWKVKRIAAAARSADDKAARVSRPSTDFVELGALRSAGSRLEVRLELGAGVVLSVARG